MLTTLRLVLRAPTEEDIPAIHEVHRHAAVADGVLSIPHPHTIADARAWLDRLRASIATADPVNRNLIWLICLAETGQVVGDCGVQWNELHRRGTLGYLLHPESWGRGFATEAVRAVLDHVFEAMEPTLHRVQADHFPDNPASGRVLEKLGFSREGVMRDFIFKNGRPRDVVRWAILRDEHVLRAAAAGQSMN